MYTTRHIRIVGYLAILFISILFTLSPLGLGQVSAHHADPRMAELLRFDEYGIIPKTGHRSYEYLGMGDFRRMEGEGLIPTTGLTGHGLPDGGMGDLHYFESLQAD